MAQSVDRTPIPSVIGMDVGGSKIRMARVTMRGRILGSVVEQRVISRQKHSLIRQVAGMVREMVSAGQGRPRAVGVGVPGFMLKESGVIYASPNFPGWHLIPFRSLLRSSLRLPLTVENDANAAALGEAWKGRGRNVKTMLYLGLGTGVGGGVVLNGRLLHGSDGLAGELGHITVDPHGPICGCGNSGCLEAYASATAIVRAYLEVKRERRIRPSRMPPTAAELSQAARAGDKAARAVFVGAGIALGIAVASLINIFNPQMVVIGGGVAEAWDLFAPAMKAQLVRRAIRPARLSARVVRGILDDRAGILGAAAVAWQQEGVEIF